MQRRDLCGCLVYIVQDLKCQHLQCHFVTLGVCVQGYADAMPLNVNIDE